MSTSRARRAVSEGIRAWFATPLWRRVLAGLVLGAVTGVLWGPEAASLQWLGDLFIRLMRMIVPPIVFVTLVSGVSALGDARRLGSMGGRAILLLILMTMIGAGVGVALGTAFMPGVGVQLGGAAPWTLPASQSLQQQVLAIVPINPVAALANGEMLGIIFFSALLGIGLLLAGDAGAPLSRVLVSAREAMLRVVGVVMEMAPFGVFALMAVAVGARGLSVFTHVSVLAACLVAGCVFQMAIVQTLLVRLGAGIPPGRFFRRILDAGLMAFSTSSSAATLPVSIGVAETRLGVSSRMASATLPLGSSLARDGTAIYVALLSMFSAEVFGVDLQPTDYVVLVLGVTLLALGAAGVPSASLFMLTGVLSLIGVTDSQAALVVGFILPFDRLLDMIRTVPSVTGNLAVTATVARWEGELALPGPGVKSKPA